MNSNIVISNKDSSASISITVVNKMIADVIQQEFDQIKTLSILQNYDFSIKRTIYNLERCVYKLTVYNGKNRLYDIEFEADPVDCELKSLYFLIYHNTPYGSFGRYYVNITEENFIEQIRIIFFEIKKL